MNGCRPTGSGDERRAIGLLTRACDASWSLACYWLGDIYFSGEFEDPPQAFLVWERACKANDQRSCASEGVMLQLGKGVGKDLRRALALLTEACKAGVFHACTASANMMAEGDGVPRDVGRARAAYEKGCSDEYPAGCYVLGLMCASGKLGDTR
jgi:TPR repeat protein